MGNPWPSLKARTLRRLLEREFGYVTERQDGSHRRMKAPNKPDLTFAFHDSVSVPPRIVRVILVRHVGLTAEEAAEVVKRA